MKVQAQRMSRLVAIKKRYAEELAEKLGVDDLKGLSTKQKVVGKKLIVEFEVKHD